MDTIENRIDVEVLNADKHYPFIRPQSKKYSCGHMICKAIIHDLTDKIVSEDRLIKIAYAVEKDLQVVKEDDNHDRWENEEGWVYNHLYFTGMRTILKTYNVGGVLMLDPSISTFNSVMRDRLRTIVEWRSPRWEGEFHYSLILARFGTNIVMADPGCEQQLVYVVDQTDFFDNWISYDGHRRIIPVWRARHRENDMYRQIYKDAGRHF